MATINHTLYVNVDADPRRSLVYGPANLTNKAAPQVVIGDTLHLDINLLNSDGTYNIDTDGYLMKSAIGSYSSVCAYSDNFLGSGSYWSGSMALNTIELLNLLNGQSSVNAVFEIELTQLDPPFSASRTTLVSTPVVVNNQVIDGAFLSSGSLAEYLTISESDARYLHNNTASYSPTASYATNAGSVQTASYALQAYQAVISNLAFLAESASYALNARTASHAITHVIEYSISSSYASSSNSASYIDTASAAYYGINGFDARGDLSAVAIVDVTRIDNPYGSVISFTSGSNTTIHGNISLQGINSVNWPGFPNLYIVPALNPSPFGQWLQIGQSSYSASSDRFKGLRLVNSDLSCDNITASLLSGTSSVAIRAITASHADTASFAHYPINQWNVANKQYVDDAIPHFFDLFFRTSSAEGIGGYRNMLRLDSPLTASDEVLTVTNASASQYVYSFISPPLGITGLNTGVIDIHFHIYRTGGVTSNTILPELYIRSGSTEYFEFPAGTPINITTATNANYDSIITITSSIDVATTDRLVCKFKMIDALGTPNLFLTVEGQTAAGISLPVPSSNFVLKSGDTMSGPLIAPSVTASLFGTASQAITASFVTASNVKGKVSSAITSDSASFVTASNVRGKVSSAITSDSASFVYGFAVNGIVGTASYASYAETSSHATYATTASYTIVTQVTQSVGSVVSASWASASLSSISSSYLRGRADMTGNMLFATDNTYNIGGSVNTNRPSNIFANSITIGSGSNGYIVTGTNNLVPSVAFYDSTAAVAFQIFEAGYMGIRYNRNAPMHFFTNATIKMSIAADGKVGIGTSVPASTLHVSSSAAGNSILIDHTNAGIPGISMRLNTVAANYFAVATAATNFFGDSAIGDTCIRSEGHKLLFGPDGNNAVMAITNSKVGINTASPTNTLHVVGNVFATSLSGSLQGTASWAEKAVSASYAPFSITSVSSSWASSSISSSYTKYAETSSFAKDLFTVDGNLQVGLQSSSIRYLTINSPSTKQGRIWHDGTYLNFDFTVGNQGLNFGTSTISYLNGINYRGGIHTFYNANTASMVINANGQVSASVFSGSLQGTSSWAEKAISASYAPFTQTTQVSASWASASLSSSYALRSTTASYSPVEPNYSASVSTYFGTKQPNLVTGNTYPITSSWAEKSISASYAPFTQTFQVSASWASASLSSSYPFASNGTNAYTLQNVGIGTSSPTALLSLDTGSINMPAVNGNGFIMTGGPSFTSTGGTNGKLVFPGIGAIDTTSDLYLRNLNGASTWITVKNDGKVGISTTTPTAYLEISGSSETFPGSYTSNLKLSSRSGTPALMFNRSPASTGTMLGLDGNGFHTFMYTGSVATDVMTILTAGNVGIGTSSPATKLHVMGHISSSAITASLYGTSSWSNKTISASYAPFTQTYQVSGSWASASLSSSYAKYAETSSFAKDLFTVDGNLNVGLASSSIRYLTINSPSTKQGRIWHDGTYLNFDFTVGNQGLNFGTSTISYLNGINYRGGIHTFYNANTASMVINANGHVSASVFSGSLQGTASWAEKADTADNATFATTADTSNYDFITNVTDNAAYYVAVTPGDSGAQGVGANTGFRYNPSGNSLTASTFKGNLIGNVVGTATNADTSAFAVFATDSTYAVTAQNANNASSADSALFATTAGDADTSISSSFASSSISASYAPFTQVTQVSASWASASLSSSYALRSTTASYSPVEPNYSASVSSGKQNTLVIGNTYNITSSWAEKAVSSSYAISSNQTSASYALHASTATTAAFATQANNTSTADVSQNTNFCLVTPDTSSNTEYNLVFTSTATQTNATMRIAPTEITFNPSTQTVSASVFKGNLTGTSSWATNVINAGIITNATYAVSASWASASLSSSYALRSTSASYSPVEPNYSASVSTYFGTKQPNLVIGNTYTITSSWAEKATSASYAPSSPSVSASYAVKSSTADLAANATNATTADTSTYTTMTNNTANTAQWVTFTSGDLGAQNNHTNAGLRYNPSNNTLTASSFAGTISNATFADSATNAGFSAEAGHADTADNALYAVSAETSSWAVMAITSAYSLASNYADEAAYADQAGFAYTAESASYAPVEPNYSASVSTYFGTKQPNLVTGTTYNITSSWAVNAVNGGTANVKAGTVACTSFAGGDVSTPWTYSVSFGTAYANTNYVIIVSAGVSFGGGWGNANGWRWASKSTTGFDIILPETGGMPGGNIDWMTTPYGNS